MQEIYNAQMQKTQVKWSKWFSGQGNCNWPQVLQMFTEDLIQLSTSSVSPKGEYLEVSIHSRLQALDRLLWRPKSRSVWEPGCKGPRSQLHLGVAPSAVQSGWKPEWGTWDTPESLRQWQVFCKQNVTKIAQIAGINFVTLYLLWFVFLKAWPYFNNMSGLMVALLRTAVKVSGQLCGWHCAISHEPTHTTYVAGPNGAPPDPSSFFPIASPTKWRSFRISINSKR